EYAVSVAVRRAARGIDLRALGRVRALVDAVADTVAVAVHRAALLVDHAPVRRVLAPVEAVEDPVAIAVDRAAVGVDLGAERCFGALVEPVADRVRIGVARLPTPDVGHADRGRDVVAHARLAAILEPGVAHLQAEVEALVAGEVHQGPDRGTRRSP